LYELLLSTPPAYLLGTGMSQIVPKNRFDQLPVVKQKN